VDRELRFVRVNQAAADINGRSPQDHLGRTIADVVPSIWPVLEPLYRRVLDDGETITGVEVQGWLGGERGGRPTDEHGVGGDSGREWWLLESFYPVRADGRVIGTGVIFVDITERKRLEQTNRDLAANVAAVLGVAREPEADEQAGHPRRVAAVAAGIGREMALPAEEVLRIELTALVHEGWGVDAVAARGDGQPSIETCVIAVADALDGVMFPAAGLPVGPDIALDQLRRSSEEAFDPRVLEAATRALAEGHLVPPARAGKPAPEGGHGVAAA
jgi:hypothetical protein